MTAATDGEDAKSLVVIANPKSGRNSAGALDTATAVLEQAGFRCSRLLPDSVEELVSTTRQARQEHTVVVIAGGDGTVHAALPGLTGPGAPVGILPLGTANDLARTLDIPTDPEEAATVIARGHQRSIDLGSVDGTYFINVAHVGLGARARRKVTKDRKRRWRALSYPISLLETLWSYRPFRIRITVNGEHRRFWAMHVAIGNGRYSGGGIPVSEKANIADGLLDVCCVRAVEPWKLLRATASVIRGTPGQEEIWRSAGARVQLHTRHRHRISADGESAGRTPATFEVHRDAVTVIAPEEKPMFRDEATVALNDLLVQCETNAEHFGHTADLLRDEPEAVTLRDLAEERRRLAASLRQLMERQDELPDTVDSERSALQGLGETIASHLADWGRTRVLEARLEDERRLRAAAGEALKHVRDADYRKLIEQIGAMASDGMQKLVASQGDADR